MRPDKRAAKKAMNAARALKITQRMAENAPAALTPAARMKVDLSKMKSWVSRIEGRADPVPEQEAQNAKRRRFAERAIP